MQKMKSLLTAIACILYFNCIFSQTNKKSVPCERKGILVIECEQSEIKPHWETGNEIKGFSGNGYITWKGENHFSTPGRSVIEYEFFVINPGTYYLQIHNYYEHPDRGENNDVFVSINNEDWLPSYSMTPGMWNWETHFERNHNWGVLPRIELGYGLNILRLSGRSFGFSIDKIALVIAEKISDDSWKTHDVSWLIEVEDEVIDPR